MAIGSFFTLFVVPAFYMLIARDHAKDKKIESTLIESEPVLAK
jgi:hypothetical protein